MRRKWLGESINDHFASFDFEIHTREEGLEHSSELRHNVSHEAVKIVAEASRES